MIICSLSIGGCASTESSSSLNDPAKASYTPTPLPVDIQGSNLALQKAATALADGNKTAFMALIWDNYGNITGEVVNFDFSSPGAARLAQGMRNAKVTDSSVKNWRGITSDITLNGKTSTLYADTIYDRVDYETRGDGKTYKIVMINEMGAGWKLAEMYSDSDTFVDTWGTSNPIID